MNQANNEDWKPLFVWILIFVASAFVLAKLDYSTRDADSMLYSEIAEQIAKKPLERWIAPVWVEGLFREHPVGIFLLPAVLARFGYPALQASYVANGVYQILCLLLFHRLAQFFAPQNRTRSLAWLLQLLPIAFVYRIRANHEQALLLCLLLALYGTERSRKSASWIALTCFALIFMMLIKGMAAIFGVAACIWWLLLQYKFNDSATEGSFRKASAGIAVSVVLMIAVAVAYEFAYRKVTGESFLQFYITRWLARPQAAEGWRILPQKLYNLIWYAGRLIWYAFPWSLPALALLLHRKRLFDAGSRGKEVVGAGVALGIVLAYLGAFSLSDQKAGRYLFPAYYILAACGILAAYKRERIKRFLERTDRWGLWLPVAVWTLAFFFHLMGGPLKFPRIRFWERDF